MSQTDELREMMNMIEGLELNDSPEVAKERAQLHDAMLAAYKKYGNVRHPKWKEAERNLRKFQAIHGTEYNPD